MHLNRRLQGETNIDQRIQPTGKATEQADASNGSENSSNGHTKCHGKREAERNAIQKEKRDEEGKEATDMPRMLATRQPIYRPHRPTMLVQHTSTQQQHTIMQMVHMVQETGPGNQELLGTGRSQCQTRRPRKDNTRRTTHHTDEEGQDEGFCQRRMVTAEDPFSHAYGGSTEFSCILNDL
jgi:hypothetical protein